MKNIGNKKQKGFALIEVGVALVVIGLATILAWPKIAPYLNFNKSATIEAHIDSIFQGTANYITNNGSCTGISLAVLGAQGYIAPKLAAGTELNSWGGGFTVACNANITQATITSTGIADTTVGAKLAQMYARRAVSAAFASGTITVVVQG
jgi:type II secretory pathway pseudopilin PulG